MPRLQKHQDDEGQQIIAILIYLIGFPIAFCLVFFLWICSTPTLGLVAERLIGVGVMAFLMIYTYILVKRRPALKSATWKVGTIILLLTSLFLLWVSVFTLNCTSALGSNGLPVQTMNAVSVISDFSFAAILAMSIGYIASGKWAIKRRGYVASALVLEFIIILVVISSIV